jgi:hypothetical protein
MGIKKMTCRVSPSKLYSLHKSEELIASYVAAHYFLKTDERIPSKAYYDREKINKAFHQLVKIT